MISAAFLCELVCHLVIKYIDWCFNFVNTGNWIIQVPWTVDFYSLIALLFFTIFKWNFTVTSVCFYSYHSLISIFVYFFFANCKVQFSFLRDFLLCIKNNLINLILKSLFNFFLLLFTVWFLLDKKIIVTLKKLKKLKPRKKERKPERAVLSYPPMVNCWKEASLGWQRGFRMVLHEVFSSWLGYEV